MKIKKQRIHILLCLFLMFLLFVKTGESFSMREHISDTPILHIEGFTTEELTEIYSSIVGPIDKVPWRAHSGEFKHREIWGHTEEWYYRGEIPEDEAIEDIMKLKDKNYSRDEAIEILKEYQGKPGRDMIAKAFKDHYPSLSEKEARALADQCFYSHILGDSTTAEGVNISPERLAEIRNNILRHPTEEALSGMNKVAMAESLKSGGTISSFALQSVNTERLYVQSLVKRHKNFRVFNPPLKGYIGIQVNGQDYVFASDYNKRAIYASKKGYRVILPDDEYQKFVKKYGENSSVTSESQITGRSSSKDNMRKEACNTAQQNYQSIKEAEVLQQQKVASITRSFAKYAIPGIIIPFFKDWGYICEAYKGYEDVKKVSLRVATDFVGYTVTPMIVQGFLAMAPKKGAVALLAGNLEQTGAVFYIGYFIYESGKEVWAYQKGDIGKEEFVHKITESCATIPVMLIVGKVAAITSLSSGPLGLLVPLAFVAGPYIFSREEQWYKDKKWADVLHVGDIEELYGSGLLNQFTFLQPEQQATILNPEQRETFLKPQKNDTILEPEGKQLF